MRSIPILAAAIALIMAPSHSQSPRRLESPAPMTVRCVDAEGRPVAGAEVHVFQSRNATGEVADTVATGPYRTDANGQAVTTAPITYDGGQFERWFEARVPGRLLGVVRTTREIHGALPAPPEIHMHASRELRGHVVVPKGSLPSTLRMRTLFVSGLEAHDVETWLPRASQQHPAVDDDGWFVLRDLPAMLNIELAAEGPGLAPMVWSNLMAPGGEVPASIEMHMVHEAVIEGLARAPDGHPLRGAIVNVHLLRERAEGCDSINWSQFQGSSWTTEFRTFAARCDLDGHFRIGGLPDADFMITIIDPVGVMRPILIKLLKSQHIRNLPLRLEAGIEVRGTVRCQNDNDKGVAGTEVCASVDIAFQCGWDGLRTRTDAEGRFTIRLPAGRATLMVAALPKGYCLANASSLSIDVQAGDETLQRVHLDARSDH